jgi:Family of unknown function (DUF6318)
MSHVTLNLHRLAPIAAASFAGLLVLTACQGPSSPAPSSSPATSQASPTPDASKPTPASSTGPARNIPVPELPEAATKETKEGLRAFADYWLSLMNYGYQTGDYAPVNKLTASGCKTCINVQKGVAETYKAGGWFVGGELTIKSYSDSFRPDINDTYGPLMRVSQNSRAKYDKTGKLLEKHSADTGEKNIYVLYSRFQNGAWRVADFGLPGGA